MPGLPTGAIGQTGAALTQPVVNAFQNVATAIKDVVEAVKTAIPVFAVMSDKFKEFGERFKDTFRIYIGEPLTNALKKIGEFVKWALPTTVLDQLKLAGARTFDALGSVAKAMGTVAVAAPVMGAAVAGLGLALSAAVAKANPAVAQQFSFALNDTIAVIGQALVPVLQVVTEMMRMFGDTLASFASDIGGPLAEILRSLMPIFQVFLQVFAAVGQVVGEVLKLVAPLIRIVAEGIATVFGWIARFVKFLLGLIGIEFRETEKGKSVGAAIRQVSHTSIEGVIQQAQKSALMLGAAGSVNYAEQTAKNTADAAKGITDLIADIRALPGRIANAMNPFGSREDGAPMLIDRIIDPAGSVRKDLDRLRKMESEGVTMDWASRAVRDAVAKARRGTDGGGTVKPD